MTACADKERFRYFISYPREQVREAERLYAKGKTETSRPYLFSKVDPDFATKSDAELQDLLRRRLEQSDALVVVLDTNHLAAEWCGWEVATFLELKGSGARLYYHSMDYAPLLHEGTFERWNSSSTFSSDGAREPDQDALSKSADLLVSPADWSRSLGRWAAGFRLLGRAVPANRERRPKVSRQTLFAGLWQPIILQVVLAILAALTGDLAGLAQWDRQLALVLAAGFASAFLLALTFDLPVALLALTYATPAALGTTWLAALLGDRVCDGMIAGGVLTGTMIGSAVAARFNQRLADHGPSSTPKAALFSVLRGVLSTAIALLAARGIFGATFSTTQAVSDGLQDALPLQMVGLSVPLSHDPYAASAEPHLGLARWIPISCGVLIGLFGAVNWILQRLRISRSGAWHRTDLAIAAIGGVLLAAVGTVVGWLTSKWLPMNTGTGIGMLSGMITALAVGGARATSARGRHQIYAALPWTLLTLGLLTAAGWWSGTEAVQALNFTSSRYALNIGVLVGFLVASTFGLDSALWGWRRRPGDDALFGAVAALMLLPVIQDVVPLLDGGLTTGRGRTLCYAFYGSVVASFVVARAILEHRLVTWLRPRRFVAPLAMSAALHALFFGMAIARKGWLVETEMLKGKTEQLGPTSFELELGNGRANEETQSSVQGGASQLEEPTQTPPIPVSKPLMKPGVAHQVPSESRNGGDMNEKPAAKSQPTASSKDPKPPTEAAEANRQAPGPAPGGPPDQTTERRNEYPVDEAAEKTTETTTAAPTETPSETVKARALAAAPSDLPPQSLPEKPSMDPADKVITAADDSLAASHRGLPHEREGAAQQETAGRSIPSEPSLPQVDATLPREVHEATPSGGSMATGLAPDGSASSESLGQGTQPAKRVANGRAVCGKRLDSQHIQLAVAAAYGLDIDLVIDAGQHVDVNAPGMECAIGNTKGHCSARPRDADFTIVIEVPRANSVRNADFCTDQSAVVGFEDAGDGDYNEPELHISVTGAP